MPVIETIALCGSLRSSETGFRTSGTGRVMEPIPSDVECLALSLSEPQAFELIFERHFAAVHRYLNRRAGPDVADDLAAETFALAFERRASCRASGSSLPWLYGIATNLLRRCWRAERTQLRAYGRRGIDRPVHHEEEAAARIDGATLHARLAQALEAMPRKQRDALVLYALADLSYEEIALALEVPLGTVRTWVHRARKVAQGVLAVETEARAQLATSGDNLNG
jgi:RNA polymerase sigma-70 factor (ECF subfamily)